MKKYIFIALIAFFSCPNSIFGQDMDISVSNSPFTVLQGNKGIVTVVTCNNGFGTLQPNRIRPQISFPNLTGTTVTVKSAPGFSVFSNTGQTVILENTATLGDFECFTIELEYTGVLIGGPSTVQGTMGFNGPQTPGNDPANDNASSSIRIAANPAPVTLSSFRVDEFTNGNLLDWKTRDEVGFSHFSVRKSLNLSEFWEIGSVNGNAKNGKYEFLDTDFQEGTNYYQLKMVDLNGSYKMSPIISIENRGEFGSTTVYPNPSPNRIFNLKNSEEFDEINLMTNEGTRLPVEVRKLKDTYEVKVSEAYSAGTYFLQFINKSRVIRRKVVLL